MTQRESYKQLSTHAQMDGLRVGLFWVITLGFFISQFAVPGMGFVWMCCMIATPFVVGWRARVFGDTVRDGHLPFGTAYLYSMQVYFCSTLILAIAFWAYLQYFDDGYLINKYVSVLTDPRSTDMLKAMGYDGDDLRQMTGAYSQAAEMLSTARPIDIAVDLLSFNLIASVVLSLMSALYTRLTARRTR